MERFPHATHVTDLDPSVIQSEAEAMRAAEAAAAEQALQERATAVVAAKAAQETDDFYVGYGGKYGTSGGYGTELLAVDEQGRELATRNGIVTSPNPNVDGASIWNYRSVTDKDPVAKLVTEQGSLAAFKAVRGDEFISPAEEQYGSLGMRELVSEFNAARAPQTVEATVITKKGNIKDKERIIAADPTKADDLLDVLAVKLARLPEDAIVDTLDLLNEGSKGAETATTHKSGERDLSGFEGMHLSNEELDDLLGRISTAIEHQDIRTERAAAEEPDEPTGPTAPTTPETSPEPGAETSEEPEEPLPILPGEALADEATVFDGATDDIDEAGRVLPEDLLEDRANDGADPRPSDGEWGATLEDHEEAARRAADERRRDPSHRVPGAPEPLDLDDDIGFHPRWADDVDPRAPRLIDPGDIEGLDRVKVETRLYSGLKYEMNMEFVQDGEVRVLPLDIFVDQVHGLTKKSEVSGQTSYSCTVKGNGKFEDFKIVLPATYFSDIESREEISDTGRSKGSTFSAILHAPGLITPDSSVGLPMAPHLYETEPQRTSRLLLSSLIIRDDMISRLREEVRAGSIPLDIEGNPDSTLVSEFVAANYDDELTQLSQMIEDQSTEELGSGVRKASRSTRRWRAGIPRRPEGSLLDLPDPDAKRTLNDWWRNPNSTRAREVVNGSDRMLEKQSPWRYQQRKARSILDSASIIAEL